MAMAEETRATRIDGKKTTLKKKLGTVKRKSEVSKLKKQYLPKRKRREARARIDAADDSSSEDESAVAPIVEDDNDDSADDASTSNKVEEKESDDEDQNDGAGNAGWADAMSRLIGTRSVAGKKHAVMAKGITDQQVAAKLEKAKAEVLFEVEPNPDAASATTDASRSGPMVAKKKSVQEKTLKMEAKERRIKRLLKIEWERQGRKKPDITKKDKERQFVRIATKGVVQLFNAVKDRQAKIAQQFSTVGGSEVKREKVMQSMSKGEFLDTLNSKGKSVPIVATTRKSKKTLHSGESEEAKPTWNILRDDYMMGATMKDWDKLSDSEEENVQVKRKKSNPKTAKASKNFGGDSDDN